MADTRRKSELSSCLPPSGRKVRDSSTRNNLACKVSGISPISSRNSVPPFACAISPCLSLSAPENAPLQ
ncbi:Uncharacterised protein [Vibrio cholerae]|uniref:Uncharacterized protein n=1 Tax=Vibrio cholerae TaxID=666 RepID=A0A655X641_VIBCL|nr:Uncharacterised protein [Vibrio cholerae]